MDKKKREKEALFKLSIIGHVVHRELKRGELRPLLKDLAGKTYIDSEGNPRIFSWRTLEKWVYQYRDGDFVALHPKPRKDKGAVKALSDENVKLVLDLKREKPGRSASLIIDMLEKANKISNGSLHVSTVSRLLRRNGLSGPQMEIETPARYRWVVSHSNELWQVDALHGPKVIDPKSGRKRKAIIFGLLDDRSRLAIRVRAGFRETQEEFLTVLYEAMARRGIPEALLPDNHGSFRGHDVRVVCGHLKINLVFARPGDGAGKGAIERFWRTFRKSFLNQLDYNKVKTICDLNLRISVWCEEQYNFKSHSGLNGFTPIEMWSKDSDKIKLVEDLGALKGLFTGEAKRKVLKDSTISFRGKVYEVPTHLRGRKIDLGYSIVEDKQVWVMDGETEVPIKEVNPEENAYRSRKQSKPDEKPKPNTGLNSMELLLNKVLGRDTTEKKELNDEKDD